jgi:hypothetical protein
MGTTLQNLGPDQRRAVPRRLHVVAFCVAILVGATAAGPRTIAAPGDSVFTVGKYPVDATAQDAVAAKERAVAEGQQAAFRSLLKRLVPVTQYSRLANLKTTIKAADFVDGVSVQSERNSSTRYIASLDFAFRPDAVRDVLRKAGIPFVDSQSPLLTIVPVMQAASGAASDGQRQWVESWSGLDERHALTPYKIAALKTQIHADTIKGALAGDAGAIRILTREYASDLVLLAHVEPDPQARTLTVTLAGTDAVGTFTLKRTYKYAQNDLGYALELASLIAHGTIEGRWKAIKARPGRPVAAEGNGLLPVQLLVEFRSLQEWQELRRQISETPGVQDVQIGGVSARSADLAIRYPGGADQLADSLAAQGLKMRSQGGVWYVGSIR